MELDLITFIISKHDHGKTVRDFLASFYLSKTNIYKLELHKAIFINEEIAKLHDILYENDQLDIDTLWIETDLVEPYQGDVELIYEDLDLAIFNKPYALLVHSDDNSVDSLNNRVNYYYQKKGYNHPVLPVHRIDYETSGIVCFAKHKLANSYLSHLFESHEIEKKYRCLVEGKMDQKAGIIDKPIGKDRHSNLQITTLTGKDAKTSYEVIEEFDDLTKLEVKIEGGRKHQIRVHLKSIMKPIVGDTLYRGMKNKRLMLHFYQIKFIHPRTKNEFMCQIREMF